MPAGKADVPVFEFPPAADDDVWPATFGHVISLQLATWRSTARQVYLDRARELGDAALERFFDKVRCRAPA